MRRFLLAAVLVSAIACAPAEASTYHSGSSTAYHTCDGSTGQTAAQTNTFFGEVASNTIPLHHWIQMVHPSRVHGRRFFIVLDTGGPGFLIDFYAPSCPWMNWWGRRSITVKELGRRDLWHGKPRGGWQRRKPWQHPRWKP